MLPIAVCLCLEGFPPKEGGMLLIMGQLHLLYKGDIIFQLQCKPADFICLAYYMVHSNLFNLEYGAENW